LCILHIKLKSYNNHFVRAVSFSLCLNYYYYPLACCDSHSEFYRIVLLYCISLLIFFEKRLFHFLFAVFLVHWSQVFWFLYVYKLVFIILWNDWFLQAFYWLLTLTGFFNRLTFSLFKFCRYSVIYFLYFLRKF
jgi:hypothetical protein